MTRRFLFVCGKNRWRSPTAEQIFANRPGVETLSAGVSRDADNLLSDDLVEWADIIFVMEKVHRDRIRQAHRAALKNTRLVVLGISDDYEFMDPELVRLLKNRMRSWLPVDGAH